MATYTVTSVTEDQTQDATGNLVDVFDISFTLSDRPGSFTVQVPQAGDVVTAAQDAIVAKVGAVEGIYSLQ